MLFYRLCKWQRSDLRKPASTKSDDFVEFFSDRPLGGVIFDPKIYPQCVFAVSAMFNFSGQFDEAYLGSPKVKKH